MANEKKTIKTKLVQVGSEKIDMPFSLSELILDSTSGKTVKELLDELDIEIGNPKDEDNNIEATGLYKIIDDKIGDIDFSTLQTKEDNTLVTTDKTIVGAIAEIINDYLGSKKLVYLTQAEYDLLSDDDKNDTTKVYNITDAEEKDYQPKEDDTLNTTDKTIVGAINELDTKVGDINNTIGKKKVNAYYVLDNTNGTLTVVDDSTDPIDPLTQVKLADVNGVASVGDKVNLVPEVGASGIFDYIDTAVTQAKLEGQDIDLSAYQKRIDDNLTTDDKNLVNVINALADDSHYHEAYTDTEIEAMFDGTAEEIAYYESLIQDNTVSVNRLFSSQEVVNRITQALLDSQKYANDLVGGLSMVKAKKVETKPDTGDELTIYLVGTEGNYHQWMFIEGAWADLGATNITLDGYITTEKLTEELAKKADDDKVLKLDNVVTTIRDTTTATNTEVPSELSVANAIKDFAKVDALPTKTSELTNDSGFLTEHQDLSEYAKSVDLPTIATTINASSTNDDVAGALAVQNKISEIIDANYLADANYPTSQSCYTNSSTLNTPYKEGLTFAQNEFIISAKKNQDTWNSQICMDIGNSTLFYRYATDSNNKWSKWTQIQTNYLQRNSRLINIPGWKRNITITFTNKSGASALIFTQYGSIIPINTAGSKVYVMDFGNALSPSGHNISWGLDVDNQMKVTINSSVGNMVGSIIINNDSNATVEYGIENNPQANVMKNPNYVEDVSKTLITFSDETNYKVTTANETYFIVRNGVAYIHMVYTCITTTSTDIQVFTGLPKPASSVYTYSIDRPYDYRVSTTADNTRVRISTTGQLSIVGGTNDTIYVSNFSYPVAES